MTKQKTQDLWNNEADALKAMADAERVHLLTLRMQKAGSTLKNVKEVHETKKNIARILTVLRQKELGK